MLIVYFSGKAGNTEKFVKKVGLPSLRIPSEGSLEVNEPYILIVPSYGGGEVKGSVPLPVIKFLNDENNRSHIKGVIGSGNTNFGEMYCYGAKIISEKCGVPLLYKFELLGTTKDVDCVRDGVNNFGKS